MSRPEDQENTVRSLEVLLHLDTISGRSFLYVVLLVVMLNLTSQAGNPGDTLGSLGCSERTCIG